MEAEQVEGLSVAIQPQGHAVMVQLAVKVLIPMDVWDAHPEVQEKILKDMRDYAHILRDIEVKGKWPGSTWLTLELTPEEAERLYWGIKSGDLAYLEIVDAELTPSRALAQSVRATLELYRSGKTAEPVSHAQILTREVRRFQPPPDQPEDIFWLNSLAALWLAEGQYSLAEELLLIALAIGRQVWGPDHANQAPSLHNLAVLYDLQGMRAEAEREYRRALAALNTSNSPRGVERAATLSNLGSLLIVLGGLDEAEGLIQQSIALRKGTLGMNHPCVAVGLRKLASIHLRRGSHREAAYYLRLARDILGEGEEAHSSDSAPSGLPVGRKACM